MARAAVCTLSYTTLFRSDVAVAEHRELHVRDEARDGRPVRRAVVELRRRPRMETDRDAALVLADLPGIERSEEHTSELQSRRDLVCRLLLETNNGLPPWH